MGNWLGMPFAADSFDWVACDGGLACLPHPDGQCRLLRETARVLRAGGLCSFRLFTPAEGEHRLEDLESLLRARRISNSSELELWLWSVLQPDPVQGVPLRHVWQHLTQTLPSLESLLLELDWRPDALDSLRAYAHSAHAYHLITEREAMALFGASELGLEVVSVERSTYSMSERCPTIVARKLPRRAA